MGKVTYDADMRARAKAEKLTLCTIDVDGHAAGRSRGTGQSYLFTPEEVEKAWAFLTWLASARNPAKAKKGK